jgi:hypothetical protein
VNANDADRAATLRGMSDLPQNCLAPTWRRVSSLIDGHSHCSSQMVGLKVFLRTASPHVVGRIGVIEAIVLEDIACGAEQSMRGIISW